MSKAARDVLAAALALGPDERAEVLGGLLAANDAPPSDGAGVVEQPDGEDVTTESSHERAWVDTLARRAADVARGEAATVDLDAAIASVEARLRARVT